MKLTFNLVANQIAIFLEVHSYLEPTEARKMGVAAKPLNLKKR